MIAISLGLGAIAVFVGLAEAARRGSPTEGVAVVEALLLLVAATGASIYALLLAFVPCGGENCEPNLGHWWDTSGSWQSYAQLGAALLGLVALIAALVGLLRKRYRWAWVWVLLAAASFAIWTVLVAPLGDGLGV